MQGTGAPVGGVPALQCRALPPDLLVQQRQLVVAAHQLCAKRVPVRNRRVHRLARAGALLRERDSLLRTRVRVFPGRHRVMGMGAIKLPSAAGRIPVPQTAYLEHVMLSRSPQGVAPLEPPIWASDTFAVRPRLCRHIRKCGASMMCTSRHIELQTDSLLGELCSLDRLLGL